MTPRSALVATAALLTSLVVVLGLAGPAGAAAYHHRDETHDVNDTSAAGPCAGCFPIAPAPTNRAEDILGMGARYDRSGLHLRLGTRSTPRHSTVPVVSWWLRTAADDYLLVRVDANRRGQVRVEVQDGGEACTDTTATFDNQRRRWTTTLPLACLEGAAWVQVGATTSRSTYSDDALVDGVTCCSAPGFTPKLRRG